MGKQGEGKGRLPKLPARDPIVISKDEKIAYNTPAADDVALTVSIVAMPKRRRTRRATGALPAPDKKKPRP